MMEIGQHILLAAFRRDRKVSSDITQYHLFNRLSIKYNKYIYVHKQSDIDKANEAKRTYYENKKQEWKIKY